MKTDNELIAEFMGGVRSDVGYANLPIPSTHIIISETCFKYMHELKCYKTWDWLMPVVEKIATIERMDFSIKAYIGSGGLQVFDSLVDSQNGLTVSFIQQKGEGSLIEVTYKSVIEFIKWYNEQKSPAS